MWDRGRRSALKTLVCRSRSYASREEGIRTFIQNGKGQGKA
nr:MAG TPA: hypothetical protein [Caudoviricetes sp.]